MLRLKKYPSRSPNWFIRGTVAGVTVFESTGTASRDQAERLRIKREHEIYARERLGEQPPITMAAAILLYANKGGESRFLDRLLDWFQDKPLKEIGQREIDEAAAALYPNASPATINRQLITPFISVARAAIKAEAPGAVLRHIERRKSPKPIINPADDEHISKLLPFCEPRLAALITLMTYTGLRTGEALRVTEADCRDGFAHIGRTKNGESAIVPLPEGWEWPSGGWGYGTTQGVGKALRRAHKAAGLPYRDGHELGRHAFAARWLAAGGDIKSLKEAGRWQKLAVVDESYGHLERRNVHERMRELSRMRAKSVKS